MKLRRLIFILILLIFIGFTACNDRPIFSVIEQEIDLKKFSVEGNVLSLLQAGDYVYASNLAGVYSKEKSSDGSWSKILSMSSTQHLAHNAAHVFAGSAKGSVKYYDKVTKTWSDVPGSGDIHLIAGNKIVFGYNASEKKVYQITNASISEVSILDSSLQPLKVNRFISAADKYFLADVGGSIKLYDNTGNEKLGLPSGAAAICSAVNANEIFVLAGSTIHYYDGSAWASSKSIKEKSPISISYFKERETILLGCTQGYTEVKVNTTPSIDLSNENTKQLDPGDEGSTTPPGSYSQYQTTLGSYNTNPMLGVSRGGSGYAVFMGIHSGVITRNKGLWGFYSDKPEWNRE